jgi:hypothetical protein
MGCFCPYIYFSISAPSPLESPLIFDRTAVERVSVQVLFTAFEFNLYQLRTLKKQGDGILGRN